MLERFSIDLIGIEVRNRKFELLSIYTPMSVVTSSMISCSHITFIYYINTRTASRINRPPYLDTAVDITVFSPNIALSCIWSVLPDSFGSDHYPVFISISLDPFHVRFSRNNKNNNLNFNFLCS